MLKKKFEWAAAIEEKGKAVIETKETDCNGWLVHELDAVKIKKWRQIQSKKNEQPMTIERLTDELEQQLIMASKMDIAISNTAVGWYEQKRMEDFKWSTPKLTDKQWAEMLTERDKYTTNLGKGGDP